jgi:urease accessory protein
MRATAEARIELRNGRSELVVRRAEAPMSLRWSAGRVLLTSSAAHPVGGDELDLSIAVGERAEACVGSVAAAICWPGSDGGASLMHTRCDVASGGHLDFAPEPTVAVDGCRHRAVTRVALAADATSRIVEEFALGRTGEVSGVIDVSLRVERAGRPLVHHDEWLGTPPAATSVSVGNARHVFTAVLVGPIAGVSRTTRASIGAAARLPVAEDAIFVIAIGADRPAVHDLVLELAPEVLAVGRAPVADTTP